MRWYLCGNMKFLHITTNPLAALRAASLKVTTPAPGLTRLLFQYDLGVLM